MLLTYPRALEECKFSTRYKRFFMDVVMPDGALRTVHCANSGSMKSCLEAESPTYILDSENEARKLRHSLELMRFSDGLACLNTARANQLVNQMLIHRNELEFVGSEILKKDFENYRSVKAEAKFTDNTRFDFCLSGEKKAWIEVKSVSLRLDADTIAFPDAVTERGQKHIRELMVASEKDEAAYLFFVVMRGADIPAATLAKSFRAAQEIDPKYSDLLKLAVQSQKIKVRIVVPDLCANGMNVRGYFEYRANLT